MACTDKPQVLLASKYVLLSISIFIPVKVLINDRASAPPASAAFAVSAISVTLGLSFMIMGFLAYLLLEM